MHSGIFIMDGYTICWDLRKNRFFNAFSINQKPSIKHIRAETTIRILNKELLQISSRIKDLGFVLKPLIPITDASAQSFYKSCEILLPIQFATFHPRSDGTSMGHVNSDKPSG